MVRIVVIILGLLSGILGAESPGVVAMTMTEDTTAPGAMTEDTPATGAMTRAMTEAAPAIGVSVSSVDNHNILATGLDDARSVRLSTLGNLFIAETGQHRILKTGLNGERLDSLGRLGSGDYQFDRPVAIDPTNELKIYVADRNNRRIQVFDRRFQYLSTIRLPRRAGFSSSYRPSLLTVDRSGRIYFFDEERHLMFRFGSNGQFELSFELFSREERIQPASMDIYDEVLWVADRRGELLHRFSTGGSYLGFIYAPEPVKSVRNVHQQIWVLGDNHVQQIDRTGRILQSVTLPEAGGSPGLWHSFDVGREYVYLLDDTRLVRLKLEEPVPRENIEETESDP